MDELAWKVLAAVVLILLSRFLFGAASTPKEESGNKGESEPADEKERKKEPAPKSCGVSDIEDLVKGSLIPATTKKMKLAGVVPYTEEEKEAKLAELEQHKTPNFLATVRKAGAKLTRTNTEVFQLNVGLYCNQACTHCHVDSSPKRKEMMNREVADQCIKIIRNSPSVRVVDITGGAPELNREFRHIVQECSKLGIRMIDRCNLTVLLEPSQHDLPAFLAEHKVHIIASLPCYLESNVDSQRGDSVFARSIKGLQLLNELGYGMQGTGLRLDLVYNPTGIHLPPGRENLEVAYKEKLAEQFDIHFNNLICITNIPINRFYDYLKAEDQLDKYMGILHDNFNAKNVDTLMCRSYLSVNWNGSIYDCDFNQQVGLHPKGTDQKEGISVFDISCTEDMLSKGINTAKHCYGCTAGAGSS